MTNCTFGGHENYIVCPVCKGRHGKEEEYHPILDGPAEPVSLSMEKDECWTLATLERYGFKDGHGHSLENCIEYVKILSMAQKYFTLDTATGGEIERLFSYIRELETKLENTNHRADTFQMGMIKSAQKYSVALSSYARASEMLKTAAFQIEAWYKKQEKDDAEIASILRCMKREIEKEQEDEK